MKRRIDPMSIAGLLLAVVLVVVGIMLVKRVEPAVGYDIVPLRIQAFYDLPSIAIVVGGTFSALMIMFPLSQFAKIPHHLKIMFAPRVYEPEKYIETLVEEAKKARINGLLSLEVDLEEMQDVFMKKSLQMLVDGVDAEEVKIQMEVSLDNLDERHAQERAFYDKGAALAPAFGMIGTLIGLINMLKDLQDIESVGPNMAVALITTFYGTLLANVFFAPISNKLRVRHEEEYLCMYIITEGVKAIQSGINPNLLQEKLINILPQYRQKKIVEKAGAEAAHDGGPKEKGKKRKKQK